MTLRALPLLPDPICVSPDTPLIDALRIMLDKGVNHVPVCNDKGWAGLVDINDVLGELLPVSARVEHGLQDLRFVGDGLSLITTHLKELANLPVSQVELHDLPTLDEDMPILEAALLLYRHAAPLPVLSSDGKFKGMLSRRTLLAHLISKSGI